MNSKKKVLLFIIDGFGLSGRAEGNAVRAANPEFLLKLFRERPFTKLTASGRDIGLPEGQMGNSEVGHLNIGAGRVVLQDITRINHALAEGTFSENPVLQTLFSSLKASGNSLHLMGMISDGGLHCHINHLYGLLAMARQCGVTKVFVHAFTDGKDTSPTRGLHFMQELVQKMVSLGVGRVATICGRYFAMDRDERWDRLEKAYHAMVHGVGNRISDPVLAVEASYKANITDEFLIPVVIEEKGQPVATIQNGDGIVAFNFRGDRMRQLAAAFSDPTFSSFPRKPIQVAFVGMTRYSEKSVFPVVFEPLALSGVLGESVAKAGLAQLRVAETEKFPHVTHFLNGAVETPFPMEERIMVPSVKVKSYDQKPEMSAFEIGDVLMEKIQTQKYSLIVANFANCDMVGHTGSMDAAMKSVSTVDCVLSKVIPMAYDLGYDCIIASDHGNAEQMIDEKTGEAYPEHTLNPVPFCLLSRESYELRAEGRLCDIAPTVLELLGIEKPAVMDGSSLIVRKK